MNGDGRADYTVVYPQTSVAYVYWNVCPDSGHSPPMTILPPLPGDPYKKRSVQNGTPHLRRPLIKLYGMTEQLKDVSG
jgi:hypothetical protein